MQAQRHQALKRDPILHYSGRAPRVPRQRERRVWQSDLRHGQSVRNRAARNRKRKVSTRPLDNRLKRQIHALNNRQGSFPFIFT